MNGGDYADSIRMDKPNQINPEEQMLRKRVVVVAYKAAPLYGIWILMCFVSITTLFSVMRPYPHMLYYDIIAVITLLINARVCHVIFQRYLRLEAKHFYDEIKRLEEKNGRI